jgi:hypothetical protein
MAFTWRDVSERDSFSAQVFVLQRNDLCRYFVLQSCCKNAVKLSSTDHL